MTGTNQMELEIPLRKGGFFCTVRALSTDGLSADEQMADVLASLPVVDGKRYVNLFDDEGSQLTLFDEAGLGAEWLMPLIDFESNEDDRSDISPLVGVAPLVSRRSVFFRIMMTACAVAIGEKETRFAEMRRLVRTLQHSTLYGWNKEANKAFLHGSKGSTRWRKAATLASIQLIHSYGVKGVLVFALFIPLAII